jgi:hypothetical protein
MAEKVPFANDDEYYSSVMSWDSSVCIVTGYQLDDPGLLPGRARFFCSS